MASEIPEGPGDASVLILGGAGFIGRNLVKFLVDSKNCKFIRVADKAIPACNYFHPEHKAALDEGYVQFKQANLSSQAHIKKVFDREFDYVVNLCGETRCSLNEQDYKLKCLDTATACAAAAAAAGTKKYIEVSSARIYAPESKTHHLHTTWIKSTEESKLDPWTKCSTARLQAEEVVKGVDGLNWVILRPAIVYGPGDLTGLTPRLVVGTTYKKIGGCCKFLWSESLSINCVHVDDVSAAIWAACQEADVGSTFNLAEDSDLDQGKLNKMMEGLFGIKTGFVGSILSNMASLNLSAAADHSNNSHIMPWNALLEEHKVLNTPISPYMDQELLYKRPLCIDGSKITKTINFKYTKKCTEEELKKQVQFFIDQGIFPAVL